MHPVGTNSAASFPKISAARVSSRFTVGSSPYTSSPTSAAAIAARISAEGRVKVSLRNSTAPLTGFARFISITTSVLVSIATLLSLSSPCPLCSALGELYVKSSPSSASLHQFHKNLIRNADPSRRQSHQAPFLLNQPRGLQPCKSCIQRNAIFPFDPSNVDPRQLPQSQKQLLLERTLRAHFLKLFHRQPSRRNRINIPRRIMRISPSLRPGKRMRPSPKSQIRLTPPILQIVPRSKSRPSPIRNLIMLIARRLQNRASRFIKLRHSIIIRNVARAISISSAQHFRTQPAPLIHLQQINRNMLRRQLHQRIHRLPPGRPRLLRQSCNQIKTDIRDPRPAQNRCRAINIRPPMHPPRRLQLLIAKRLHPITSPIIPRRHPCRRLFLRNRLRVCLQRNFHQLRSKIQSNSIHK